MGIGLALIGLLLSAIALILYHQRLRDSLRNAPPLVQPSPDCTTLSSVTVVVPAYNEADNVMDCLTSILESTTAKIEVLLIDDGSDDATLTLAQSLAQQRQDPRLTVCPGQPRPLGELWQGKNWACTQGADSSQSTYLLFIDADVRLKPGAIEKAIATLNHYDVSLLTGCPALICQHWSEWLVQPLIFTLFSVSCPFAQVCDPDTETVFAAGPFMLFRRQAYQKIGGHRALAAEIVEDVELARRVKQARLGLLWLPIPKLAQIQMYQSWQDLWEGWTKNFYLGARRRPSVMLSTAFWMLVLYIMPWLGLVGLVLRIHQWGLLETLALLVVAGAIALEYQLRRLGQDIFDCPPRFWWLSGLGGACIIAIALASWWKTETGQGWTWRGRQLTISNE